ncbi:hypothetical protein Gasu2_33610 [Galdieria sulphuraria]|nr:hypothetical protein Gasu2_33610 [Galdieria sulphuraria]
MEVAPDNLSVYQFRHLKMNNSFFVFFLITTFFLFLVGSFALVKSQQKLEKRIGHFDADGSAVDDELKSWFEWNSSINTNDEVYRFLFALRRFVYHPDNYSYAYISWDSGKQTFLSRNKARCILRSYDRPFIFVPESNITVSQMLRVPRKPVLTGHFPLKESLVAWPPLALEDSSIRTSLDHVGNWSPVKFGSESASSLYDWS